MDDAHIADFELVFAKLRDEKTDGNAAGDSLLISVLCPALICVLSVNNVVANRSDDTCDLRHIQHQDTVVCSRLPGRTRR